jgi:hypothetical protein
MSNASSAASLLSMCASFCGVNLRLLPLYLCVLWAVLAEATPLSLPWLMAKTAAKAISESSEPALKRLLRHFS